MSLTTLELVEESLGRELEGSDAAQVEYFIGVVSQLITSYTGTAFAPETITERLQANYYGELTLSTGPVSAVDSVKQWGTDSEHWAWRWGGLETIYGLSPAQVVDVTYDSGFTETPSDVQMVATEAVKRLFLAPDGEGQDVGPLSSFKVGDVEEVYKIPEGVLAAGLFNDIEKLILDGYRSTETTWRLGHRQPAPIGTPLPNNDSSLWE